MASVNEKYRLGLDLGTNSIGWAAVKLGHDGEPGAVLDIGVRIFPDGRKAGSNATDRQSNAVDRRLARGQRRRHDRYLTRREKLTQALVACGLMPEREDERKNLEGLDPYRLRARALDEPLPPHELGRALFHLNQRRGFKSNRKAAGDVENEDGKIRADISGLRRQMEESGARALGEFLARRHQRGKTVRARPGQELYPDRAMYEEEFDAIQAAQESHHCLSAAQWENLSEIILFQRPLHPVSSGRCQFEEDEPRAAKALPAFQEFRMLQEMNNLRVHAGAEPERPLNEAERKYALQRLRDGREINLQKPTGLLKGLTFNLAAGGRKSVKGDETASRLAKPERFGKGWAGIPLDERNEIVRFLLNTEDSELVRQRAIGEWGLNDHQADAVANVSLAPGYGNLSEKAILKILPHLEKGRVFSDAVQDAGYRHHSDFRNDEARDELSHYGEALPPGSVGANGRIANPTVHVGLNQLRRVVNQLVATYGKPQEIVVELARELKMNREQKRNYEQQQGAGGKRNDDFRKLPEESGLPVTAAAIRKLRLWEEQGPVQNRVCPYTGKQLSFAMVMSPQTEVDHILPFSRTLDNSMANLVVCMADANREKGDRTPHEAFGDRCLEYVKDFPANKRWRSQENAMERFEGERDFLDRQLNETQYLSRTARTYLAWLYDEQGEGGQRVRAIPGRMTALLRRAWGLEGMLRAADEIPRKQRDDHRHHAIDAFVVANTTQGLLQRFAQAAGSDYRDAAERLAALVPPPWEGFDRSEVQAFLDRSDRAVSYKPDHGTRDEKGQTTGQLHNETAYGIINLAEDGPSEVVHRKKLSDFKKRDDLARVRDEKLREALTELWDKVAAEGGKPADFVGQAWSPGVRMSERGRRQQVRSVRVVEQLRITDIKPKGDKTGKPYKGYVPGGNEFADIWEMPPDQRGRKQWQMTIVRTFDANQPDSGPERPHPAAKRLMRIYKGDMGAVGEGKNRRIVHIRQIFQPGRLLVSDHQREAEQQSYRAEPLRKAGFRKVRVDELGRVHDRGPFQP